MWGQRSAVSFRLAVIPEDCGQQECPMGPPPAEHLRSFFLHQVVTNQRLNKAPGMWDDDVPCPRWGNYIHPLQGSGILEERAERTKELEGGEVGF